MRRFALALVAWVGSAVAGAGGAWAAATTDKLAAIRVQDLHYGDVLFHFYQDDNFEALTRLLAYGQWGRLPHHLADAELLAGGLYLSLGMHNEAIVHGSISARSGTRAATTTRPSTRCAASRACCRPNWRRRRPTCSQMC